MPINNAMFDRIMAQAVVEKKKAPVAAKAAPVAPKKAEAQPTPLTQEEINHYVALLWPHRKKAEDTTTRILKEMLLSRGITPNTSHLQTP